MDANPYASPAVSMAVSRPTSLLANVPQFLILIATLVVGSWVAGVYGWTIGAGVCLLYSKSSRWVLLRAHRRGLRLAGAEQFEAAIQAYQESHAFFTRHPWVDRYRWVTLMMPAAMTYREMALLNIAYCYLQRQDATRAKEYYRRVLKDFPANEIAIATLQCIEEAEKSTGQSA
jgi:tetratricopeptide (TPR) repeat protein